MPTKLVFITYLLLCGCSTVSIADSANQGINGRWQAQDLEADDITCDYTLQLNSDYSWEDTSKHKYRSGVYIIFDKPNSASSDNKLIVLSTTTDNFLSDCYESPYDSIGTSQVLEYSSSSQEIKLSTISNINSSIQNHPIPPNTSVSLISSDSNIPSLRPLQPSETNNFAHPTTSLDDASGVTSTEDQIDVQETDNQTSSTNSLDVFSMEESASPISAPQPDETSVSTGNIGSSNNTPDESTDLHPSSPELNLGRIIKKEDWVITKPENISIGNHTSDFGFVSSQANDNESIRVRIQQESNWGTGSYFLLPPGVQEAWVSFCIRFSDKWTTAISGKLPGFSGNTSVTNGGQGGRPSTGNNAWSARMMYGSYDSSADSIPLGQYVYHKDQSTISRYGDPDWWAPEPNRVFRDAIRISRSQWHSIKQRVRVNSKNNNDGIIESWVNDKKVYSRKNFNFTNNEDFREIYRIWLDTYHGGSPNKNHEQFVYYDQFNYSIDQDNTHTTCGL